MLEALIVLSCFNFNNSTSRSMKPEVANNKWSPFWYTKSEMVIKIVKYYCLIYVCCFINVANLPNIYVNNK